jgi:hypothetical protein
MSWAPSGFRGRRAFAEGEVVEIRYLPGEKQWEKATYVRRVRQDEMPPLWRGPLGHYVKFNRPGDARTVQVTNQRIRQIEAKP